MESMVVEADLLEIRKGLLIIGTWTPMRAHTKYWGKCCHIGLKSCGTAIPLLVSNIAPVKNRHKLVKWCKPNAFFADVRRGP